ncbi:MAG TPA: hypothetical protein PLB59_03545 [Bacteroidales bacterium]|nr:hypothetical protein [Bacteroidales bacterium]HPI29360.1 hypothetical protein [Bacteroidales bacterium]HQN16536.1 hypothetical protein [Bacteroidales bacterium]HQP15019.1 hypothetical protein [Bacteroidales bacterium]
MQINNSTQVHKAVKIFYDINEGTNDDVEPPVLWCYDKDDPSGADIEYNSVTGIAYKDITTAGTYRFWLMIEIFNDGSAGVYAAGAGGSGNAAVLEIQVLKP